MKLSIKIMLAIVAVIVVVNAVLFYLIGQRYEHLLDRGLTDVGRTIYKQVVTIRSWVALHEGVYVEGNSGAAVNPYLDNPVVVTMQGDTLIRKNPASVTRELSEMSPSVGGMYQFHLTSLNLVNPANAPDPFERKALQALHTNDKTSLSPYNEFTKVEERNGQTFFRYFAPLYVEESCLSCHGDQGYDHGDIRGGISITFPTGPIEETRAQNFYLMLAGCLVATIAISVLIYLFMDKKVIKPIRKLESAAENIGKGDYNTPIVPESNDEMGDLALALSHMQEEIKATTNKQIEYEKMYALGQLSAGIAHEIRNPLFAVHNDLDFMERHYGDSKEQMEIYEEMDEGISRISRVINAVLDYAKPHRPEFREQSIKELIDRTMALMTKQFEKEGVSIQIQVDDALPLVEMNIHRMEQVLVNLLTNAKNAIDGKPGHIRINASGDSETVTMSIADDGHGMSEEDLAHLYEPFYSRTANGTGLGLTIVYRIIEQHSGDIRVTSEVGSGTKFIITLPVTQSGTDGYAEV